MTAALEAATGQNVPHSDDIFVRLVEAVSPEAVSLPRNVFNGPHDQRWIPNSEGTAFVPLP
ncbi:MULTISPECIES: hypothetical protein [unclassified Streptomyces]|uniref:hypothetical protein n=1 Tax=unclassified Streptomyces TaxID=2593676 RepID=UPI002257618C|nr:MULTISPECIES: hypothetical protein [unclassified Streptomyces]MCX4791252.1 hypothetical protein [Streptomyces sp. NBC_01221]WSP59474.1 hypothetical protein OG306_37685 [Streptomyces sp. NBC_01241]WSP60929.1 hypothetical protein OG466_02735 [Streptomyces sp. NBC_01240]WTA39839.1 hypothetical protein OG936_34475 [Streptomyces sp. NBC_00846]